MEWAGSIQEWQVVRKRILLASSETSVRCAIFVTPPTEADKQKITVEEMRAIYIT
jgi:hypothetical protein